MSDRNLFGTNYDGLDQFGIGQQATYIGETEFLRGRSVVIKDVPQHIGTLTVVFDYGATKHVKPRELSGVSKVANNGLAPVSSSTVEDGPVGVS